MKARRLLMNSLKMQELINNGAAYQVKLWARHPSADAEPGDCFWVAEAFTVEAIEPGKASGRYLVDDLKWTVHNPKSKILHIVRHQSDGTTLKRPQFSMPQELSRFTLEVKLRRLDVDLIVFTCQVHSCNVAELRKEAA
jgi:hypothetical protein